VGLRFGPDRAGAILVVLAVYAAVNLLGFQGRRWSRRAQPSHVLGFGGWATRKNRATQQAAAVREHHRQVSLPLLKTSNHETKGILGSVRAAAPDRGGRGRVGYPRPTMVGVTGLIPQVGPLDGQEMYPIYAKCVELGVRSSLYGRCSGTSNSHGAQLTHGPDEICWFFPELQPSWCARRRSGGRT